VTIGAMALAIALTINAGAAAPQVASSDKALLLNQHDSRFSVASDAGTAFAVEQARISAGAAASDEALLLNQHDPRFSAAGDAGTAFELEQARISRGASAPAASAQDDAGRFMPSNKSQNPAGNALNQQMRDVIQARWLAQHGGTSRTCVLLCGGR
jgi:hypothetical protein